MKIRHREREEKISLQMTPMIEIVFQLLIFFIMTFKIVSLEGDFNIKMPAAAPSAGTPDEDQLPPITLRLTANPDGELSGLLVNDQRFPSFQDLHRYIIDLVGEDAGPDSGLEGAEIEIACVRSRMYINVVDAQTAVTGQVTDDGTLINLIEKHKFTPPEPDAF